MTEEANSKKNHLKGRENFLPWLTRMETLLTLDEVLTKNKLTSEIEIVGATDALKKKNEKIAKKYYAFEFFFHPNEKN